MRKIEWLTTRWLLPRHLRSELYSEAFSKKEFSELLGPTFLESTEARRDRLEGRQFKILGMQFPLLALLVFSQLPIKAKISVFSISPADAQSLREIAIVISVTLGVYSVFLDDQVRKLNEIIATYVARLPKGNRIVEQLLAIRYGTLGKAYWRGADNLSAGIFQSTALVVAAIAFFSVIACVIVLIIGIHVAVLLDIYSHPTLSRAVSVFVIVIDIVALVGGIAWGMLNYWFQPFKSSDDVRKLDHLKYANRGEYDRIMSLIVEGHLKKGLVRRLLTRPKMPRI